MKKDKTPLGRTLQTNDNCFEGQRNAVPKDRRIVIIEVNQNNELGVVALSTRKTDNSTELKGRIGANGEKSYFKHFVEVKDECGKPIVKGTKFRENHKNNDLTAQEVSSIQKTVYSPKTKQHQRNAKNRNWLYNRPPKNDK